MLKYYFILDKHIFMDLIKLGEKIKSLAKQKNISPEMLSGAVGIARTTLYNYYNGSNKIEIDVLDKMSDYLGVHITYWFDDMEAPPIGSHPNIDQTITNNLKHKVELQQQEIEGLKREMKMKDKIIELLEEGKGKKRNV